MIGRVLTLGIDRKNSVRVLPKKVNSLVARRERSCNKRREGRAKTDKEERVRQETIAEEVAKEGRVSDTREVAFNTPVVNPQSYDPSCDLCYFPLWTYAVLYDCGIILLCMLNLIKDLLLMFNNMNLDFGTIINVNVPISIFVVFECCYY